MPRVRFHANPSEYWEAIRPALLRKEALNNLAIGLAMRFVEIDWRPDAEDTLEGAFLASVWLDNGDLDFAAWWMPPHAFNVTGGSSDGLALLLRAIQDRGVAPLKCHGPADRMDTIASLMGRPSGTEMETALFELERVLPQANAPSIEVLCAGENHRELIRQWTHRFAVDCHFAGPESAPPVSLPHLDDRQAFIALNQQGIPVSMAAITRQTPRTSNLSYVFTPQEQRGHGYASALVASVSQSILDGGKERCTLFTDLANPTSNRIYRALGYQRIGSFRVIRFTD